MKIIESGAFIFVPSPPRFRLYFVEEKYYEKYCLTQNISLKSLLTIYLNITIFYRIFIQAVIENVWEENRKYEKREKSHLGSEREKNELFISDLHKSLIEK